MALRNRTPRQGMRCMSCNEEYGMRDGGACKKCYEKTEEDRKREIEDLEAKAASLKRENEDLKSKVHFLCFWSPHDHNSRSHCGQSYTDVVLVASSEEGLTGSIPAHKAVLVSHSPVFKAMLENDMEESQIGTIRIADVTYDVLLAFVNYLYSAEECLDEQTAYKLLELAEKYQVKHLKSHCEKFLVTKLNWDNSVMNYAFAHQHNAKHLLDAALLLITDNMDKLTEREDYKELVEMDPWCVVELYKAYNMDEPTKRVDYEELMEEDPQQVVKIYEACISKPVNARACIKELPSWKAKK